MLYRAMFESIAADSHLGLNIVVDVGQHDSYSVPRRILADCALRLSGLPAWFIGMRCPLEVVLERRQATWGQSGTTDGSAPTPVRKWQEAVHEPGIYDLEVDTSQMSPERRAEVIRQRLGRGPPSSAFHQLQQWRLSSSSVGIQS